MHVRVCVHVWAPVCTCGCLCIRVGACVHVCTPMYTCGCLCSSVHACVHVWVPVFMCALLCTRVGACIFLVMLLSPHFCLGMFQALSCFVRTLHRFPQGPEFACLSLCGCVSLFTPTPTPASTPYCPCCSPTVSLTKLYPRCPQGPSALLAQRHFKYLAQVGAKNLFVE